MKRIGNIYEKICDIENIKNGIRKASKGKHSRTYVKRVINNIDKYALKLQQMLINEQICFGKDKHKTIIESSSKKERKITIPRFFPDQCLHWAIMLQLQPIIFKGMYHYCIGSVPNRGGRKGKIYIEKIMRNDKKIKYCLKLDIKHFFENINTNKLYELFTYKIKDIQTLKLIKLILEKGGKGLPIGYYTSQWFSNFYLERLDHFIKEKLCIKYYIRYVDDMVLIDTNKRKLRKALAEIKNYLLENNYELTIKENWQLFKIGSRPIDFLGYKFYRNYTKLRNKIFFKTQRKLNKNNYSFKEAQSTVSLMGWLIKPNEPLKNKLTNIISKETKYGKTI